eukprot:4270134-Prymnesium_polylepis.2
MAEEADADMHDLPGAPPHTHHTPCPASPPAHALRSARGPIHQALAARAARRQPRDGRRARSC